jgi:hypothetical protein
MHELNEACAHGGKVIIFPQLCCKVSNGKRTAHIQQFNNLALVDLDALTISGLGREAMPLSATEGSRSFYELKGLVGLFSRGKVATKIKS